jgi:hypothetical protein
LPKVSAPSPLADAEIGWVGLTGFPLGNRTDYYLQMRGDPRRGRTDAQGKTSIVIEGRKQLDRLPPTKVPVKKEGSLRLTVAPKPATPWDAILTAGTGKAVNPITIAAKLLMSTKWFGFDYTFEVHAWESERPHFVLDRYFERDEHSYEAAHYSGSGKLGGRVVDVVTTDGVAGEPEVSTTPTDCALSNTCGRVVIKGTGQRSKEHTCLQHARAAV